MSNYLDCTIEYPGDMTSWMFEDNPRFDYHLLQFVKRYEIECKRRLAKIEEQEEANSKELAVI